MLVNASIQHCINQKGRHAYQAAHLIISVLIVIATILCDDSNGGQGGTNPLVTLIADAPSLPTLTS